MRMRQWLPTACVLAALVVTSCGKDGPTGPAMGGGGAANPTFNSGNLSTTPGSNVFVFTFADTGVWGYRCTIHTGMTASVKVSPAGVDSPEVTITSNLFTPNLVHVKTGSYVKWTLVQGVHTVTRP